MKRLLALILVAFMVFSLVACSDKKESKSHTKKEKDDTTQTEKVEETEAQEDDGYPVTGNIVYFRDTLGWGENGQPLYVYYWDSTGVEMVQWPGGEMTSLGDNVYSFDLPDGVEFIIFNKHQGAMTKEGQTRDIPYDGSVRKFQASEKLDEMKASYATDWDGNEIGTNQIDDGSGYNQLIANTSKLATIESNDTFDVGFTYYNLDKTNSDVTFNLTVKNNTKSTLSKVKFFVLAYNEDGNARIIDIGPAANVGLGDDAYIQEYETKEKLNLKPGDSKVIKLDAEKKTIYDFNAIVSSYTTTDGKEVFNSNAYEWYKNAYTNKVVDNSVIFNKFSSLFDSDVKGVTKDYRGAITLDATVLFDVDSSALSKEGKANLKKVIDTYVESVSANDGTILVKKITVEGHTDPDGTREHNQKLSEARATAVKDYCVSLHPKLKECMVIKGCADDDLVKKSDGTVDKKASRRVCFVAE